MKREIAIDDVIEEDVIEKHNVKKIDAPFDLKESAHSFFFISLKSVCVRVQNLSI
jgi:hypothetical protein